MKRPLNSRVERLEQIRSPLLMVKSAELAALEEEYAKNFPMPISAWSNERCEQFFAYQGSNVAARLDELRERAKPAAQRAEEEAARILISRMSVNELKEYIAARFGSYEENPP